MRAVVDESVVLPDEKLFDDEEGDRRGDVALERKEIAAVGVREGAPESSKGEVCEEDPAVKLLAKMKRSADPDRARHTEEVLRTAILG